jgi:hypothetical protein
MADQTSVSTWVILIVGLGTPISTIVGIFVTAWMGRRASADSRDAAREARNAAKDATGAAHNAATLVAEVAVKTEEVRHVLAETEQKTSAKLDDIATVTNSAAAETSKVHILVNSNMGIQLKLTAAALRQLADYTKDPKHRAQAEEAERLSAEHESKQLKVDKKQAAQDNSGEPSL